MEKKEIFKKVGMIVAELNEQYQYLSENPENLNDLELELFLANSNFLTDHIEILRKINGSNKPPLNVHEKGPQPANIPAERIADAEAKPENPPVNSPESSKISEPEKAPVEEGEPENSSVNIENSPVHQDEKAPEEAPEQNQEPSVTLEEDKDSQDEKREPVAVKPESGEASEDKKTESAENLQVSSQQPAAEHAPVAPEEIIKEVVIPEKTISVDTSVIADEPAVLTINDMISAQVNPSTVATRFTSHPVADLKTIISLNDKLLFVKDLFNGYTLAYSEAIELLNRFDSFEAADNFLKVNYAAKNNWSEKQPTVDKLYEALSRRFAK